MAAAGAGIGWHQSKHKTNATLISAAEAASARGLDAYFALAGYQPDAESKVTRTKKHAAWLRSLWLDVDCGEGKPYPDHRAGLTALLGMIKAAALPKPIAVNSGHGWHFYWPFTQDVPMQAWLDAALRLQDVASEHGLEHDRVCAADCARVLRVPGTFNYKRGGCAPVSIVGPLRAGTPYEVLLELLGGRRGRAEPVFELPAAPQHVAQTVNADLAVPQQEYAPSDAGQVAESCAQVRAFRDTKGNIPEPLWRVLLGVVKFTEGGEALCHEWSSGHPTYSRAETQNKLDKWHGRASTCEAIGRLNPEGCAGCPVRGVVASPITLGEPQPEPVRVEGPPGEPPQEITLPRSMRSMFSWDGHTLKAKTKDSEMVSICTQFFYPEAYYSTNNGDERAAHSTWVVKDKGVTRRFALSGEIAGVGGRELFAVLGRNAIFTSTGTRRFMEQYVTDWFNALRRSNEETRAFSTFGWHGDDFLVGRRLYCADGRVLEARLQGDAARYADAFTPAGSLDVWVQGIDKLYNRPHHEQFQWMFGVGFGAPLVKLWGAGMAGCIVNGYSAETAQGKSTAGKLALGLYGSPDRLALTKQQATTKGLFAYCGMMNSLPILLDEITNAKNYELSELVYTFSQGTGRIGATGDGSLRTNVYEWATLMASTSNRATHTTLAVGKADAGPEIARVFEYRFSQTDCKLTKLEADNLIPQLMAQSGVAGSEYLAYVVSHQAEVKALMAATRDEYTRRAKLGAEDRYWAAAAATITTGLRIAKNLKLINFDLERLVDWAVERIESMRADAKQSLSSVQELLGAMLNELSPHFLVTDTLGDTRRPSGRSMIIHAPKGHKLLGRTVLDENALHLPIPVMRAWCHDNQVDYRQFIDSLILEGFGDIPQPTFALGKGTMDYATAPVRCIKLDIEKMGGGLAAISAPTPLVRVK